MARIQFENLSKVFGHHTALDDLDLDVADGEFFVLLGPTGAGKTTTLRLIAGLEKPTSGRVRIDGIDVSDWGPAERDVALVLQQYSLYPRLTVRENLSFPLQSRIRRMSAEDIEKRIAYASKTLRIEHLLDRKTDRLSGGEMQRVSIGRAIVREPRVFLMDEPLSALDAKLREALRSELKDLQMRLGATFIFVTHDQVEAMTMGDRIGVLNKGRIVQVGTPREVYSNPRDTFVASFVGSPAINLLPGELREDAMVVTPKLFELPLNGSVRARAGSYTFGVRPEDVLVESGAPVEAKVHDIENHGIEKILTLRVGETLLRATVPAMVNVAVEDAVRFGLRTDKVMMFDSKTGVNLGHRQKGDRQSAIGNREAARTGT
jgi:multiple sugar transport system ATP-binding protein